MLLFLTKERQANAQVVYQTEQCHSGSGDLEHTHTQKEKRPIPHLFHTSKQMGLVQLLK